MSDDSIDRLRIQTQRYGRELHSEQVALSNLRSSLTTEERKLSHHHHQFCRLKEQLKDLPPSMTGTPVDALHTRRIAGELQLKRRSIEAGREKIAEIKGEVEVVGDRCRIAQARCDKLEEAIKAALRSREARFERQEIAECTEMIVAKNVSNSEPTITQLPRGGDPLDLSAPRACAHSSDSIEESPEPSAADNPPPLPSERAPAVTILCAERVSGGSSQRSAREAHDPGASSGAPRSTRGTAERDISPALRREGINGVAGWSRLSESGVTLQYTTATGSAVQLELQTRGENGLRVVLRPESDRERSALRRDRREIQRRLEASGYEVGEIIIGAA